MPSCLTFPPSLPSMLQSVCASSCFPLLAPVWEALLVPGFNLLESLCSGASWETVVSKDADQCPFNDPLPPEWCPLVPLCPVCKLFVGEYVGVNTPSLNRTDIFSTVPVVHQDWIVFSTFSGLLLVVPWNSRVWMSLVAILQAPDQRWYCLVGHLFGLILERVFPILVRSRVAQVKGK